LAVTVNVWASPAMVGSRKPATTRVEVAAGVTVIAVWLPVIVPMLVSVAVIDCSPAVLSVALKVWTPASAPVKVWSAGRIAWASELVKWTVPV
jgi:hypothetical protein